VLALLAQKRLFGDLVQLLFVIEVGAALDLRNEHAVLRFHVAPHLLHIYFLIENGWLGSRSHDGLDIKLVFFEGVVQLGFGIHAIAAISVRRPPTSFVTLASH